MAPDEGLFSNRNIGQICLNIHFCFIILFTSSSPSRFIFFYTLLLYWSRSTAGMGDTAPLIGCRCGLANFLYILASFRRALRTVWPDKSICKENSTINQDYPARCLFLTDIHSSDWFQLKFHEKKLIFHFQNDQSGRAPQCSASRAGNYIPFILPFLVLTMIRGPFLQKSR